MTRSHNKSLNCKICGREVKNVGEDAVAVTCTSCVSKGMQAMPIQPDEEDINEEE